MVKTVRYLMAHFVDWAHAYIFRHWPYWSCRYVAEIWPDEDHDCFFCRWCGWGEDGDES